MIPKSKYGLGTLLFSSLKKNTKVKLKTICKEGTTKEILLIMISSIFFAILFQIYLKSQTFAKAFRDYFFNLA